MKPFEKRREESIKRAFLYVNKLKVLEQKKTFKIPFYIKENGLEVDRLFVLCLFIDFSFKLYIAHHTNTEEELAKLDHCCMLLWSMLQCPNEETGIVAAMAVNVVKAIYPLLDNNDKNLAKLSGFYRDLFTHKDSPLESVESTHGIFCGFFAIALTFANIFAEVEKNIFDSFRSFPAYKATSTTSQPYWEYVKPVFERCASKIPPSPTPEQIGDIFNRHFKASKAEIETLERQMGADQSANIEEPQKLELVLRLHGLWNKEKYDDGSFEDEKHLRSRMRRNWCKTFRNWYEKEQKKKQSDEERVLEFMEKFIWKRVDAKVLITKASKNFGVNDITQWSPETMGFFNNIIQELNNRYPWDIKA